MASSFQTLSDVYSDVRFQTGKDSNTLSDANLLRIANKWFLAIFRELVDINEDLYAEISNTALVANQGEYPLPVDTAVANPGYGSGSVNVRRVEVSYDGTNWHLASPTDIDSLRMPVAKALSGDTAAIATLNGYFSALQPFFSNQDRSLWLFPIPTSADSVAANNTNLRIFWTKRPYEMTASSDIPELPKDFLGMLSEAMLIDIFRKYGRITEMRDAQNNLQRMLAGARAKEVEVYRPMVLRPDTNLEDYS